MKFLEIPWKIWKIHSSVSKASELHTKLKNNHQATGLVPWMNHLPLVWLSSFGCIAFIYVLIHYPCSVTFCLIFTLKRFLSQIAYQYKVIFIAIFHRRNVYYLLSFTCKDSVIIWHKTAVRIYLPWVLTGTTGQFGLLILLAPTYTEIRVASNFPVLMKRAIPRNSIRLLLSLKLKTS